MKGNKYSLKISLFYLIFGILWIAFSDSLVWALSVSKDTAALVSLLKGGLYVGVTTIFLYFLSHRYIKELTHTNQRLRQSFDELTATHETLAVTEEELRQQYEQLLISQEKINTQNAILSTLQKTSASLINQLDLDTLLDTIIHNACQLAGTPHGFIFLLDKEQQLMNLTVAFGLSEDHAGTFSIAPGLGQVGEVLRTGQTSIVEDYSTWEHRLDAPHLDIVKSMLQVPLKSKEEVIGTFGFAFTEPGRRFDDSTVELLERFASLASVAINNAQLHTRLKQDLDALTKQEQTIRILLQALPDLLLRINNQGLLLDSHFPENFALHAPPKELCGESIYDILPADIAQNLLNCIQIGNRSGMIQLLEYQALRNNQLYYCEARFVKIGDDEMLVIIRDITYKKKMEQQLDYLSLHDPLTSVYNRTHFEEQLRKIQRKHKKSMGIIMCDVDGLKLINDTLGHHAGDQLLQVVAKILQACAPPPHVVARIGGDEFAVIVQKPTPQLMTDLDAAVKAAVQEYNKTNLHLPLSLSLGWAADYGKEADVQTLFKEADYNMYREKMHQGLSTRSAIVQAMMQALEARDYITEGHADRLQSLVERLARKLALSSHRIADLRLLAKFHDIGKVGIPDRILFKNDRLTPEEYTVMQRHCEIGFRIAQSAPDLAPIAEWILKHHEWWNGKGYPLGLSGEDIPLECRMLAIADAFDAMTTNRPYRLALDQQAAIEELLRCSGLQFDPALISPFMEMLQEAE